MKTRDLLNDWAKHSYGSRTESTIALHLPLKQLARILALVDLFPEQTKEQIITDLLEVALDDIEATMPYIKGNNVIAEDEFGDPTYEDIGLTPRMLALSKKHLKQLQSTQPKLKQNE